MKKRAGKKVLQILLHIVAWLFFLSMLTSLVPKPLNISSLLSVVVPDLFFISFFYLNYYILVPRLFITRQYLIFGAVCALYLAITIAIPSTISDSAYNRPEFKPPPERNEFRQGPPPPGEVTREEYQKPEMPPPGDGRSPLKIRLFIPEFSYTIFVFLFILTLSTGLRILIQLQQSEKEKVKAELSLLKAQINPHFLFNTLNSIYSLAVVNDRKTPEAIQLFSDLMRYALYESSHDYIPLDKKLGYIDTFVELQKMRMPANVLIQYEKKGKTGDLSIAPLILMPFIENAFKYGVSTEKDSFIYIGIEIAETDLILKVRNSKSGNLLRNSGSSQLGIENTMSRLSLLYPGKHELRIDDTFQEYSVCLQLRLK
jgi:hypothetical protein